jgi:hypothetical protein
VVKSTKRRRTVQYLALIYANEDAWASASPEEREAGYGEYARFAEAARAAGVIRGGDELDHTSTATTVRVRDREQVVTDGPYAELKEALGGYFVLECGSIEEACEWAAKIPAAQSGAIEVRPLHVEEAA